MVSLSWIIPAYNEAKRIEKTLREVDAYLRSKNFPDGYEIIVVDSSSPDHTGEMVKKLSHFIPYVSVLTVENKGKGWAVGHGMAAAQGAIRLFSDADNSTRPHYFDAMEPLFSRGCDVVISSRNSRDAPGAGRDVEEPRYREILGALGNVIIRVVGVRDIRDTQNGFKGCTARAADNIFPRMRMNGFSFDIEVLALARRLGYKIGIIPVRWRFEPESKVTLKTYFEVLVDVFRIRWNLIINKYGL